MTIEEYNSKKGMLKSGYTTGTCAAAAAKAAVFILLGNEPKDCEAVEVSLPVNIKLQIPIEKVQIDKNGITVFVQKYSGDDPDITNGMWIGARAEFIKEDCAEKKEVNRTPSSNIAVCKHGMHDSDLEICAGVGIGRITKAGLCLPVHEPAINPTPRSMIASEIKKMMEANTISSKIRVIIFAPDGEEIAKKTFNPKLGIEGGISILGTTGLVMPMSSKALIETIEVEMKFQKEKNGRIIAAPGAYGSSFLKSAFGIGKEDLVEFSNYPGEMLDIAVKLDVDELVICGHIGKMVKLAGGIMNTHSNEADARVELLASHVLKVGKNTVDNEISDGMKKNSQNRCKSDYFDIAAEILNCLTTTQAIEILKEAKILKAVMESLTNSMRKYVLQRMEKAMAFQKKNNLPRIEVMVYTLEEGLLARAGDELLLENKG